MGVGVVARPPRHRGVGPAVDAGEGQVLGPRRAQGGTEPSTAAPHEAAQPVEPRHPGRAGGREAPDERAHVRGDAPEVERGPDRHQVGHRVRRFEADGAGELPAAAVPDEADGAPGGVGEVAHAAHERGDGALGAAHPRTEGVRGDVVAEAGQPERHRVQAGPRLTEPAEQDDRALTGVLHRLGDADRAVPQARHTDRRAPGLLEAEPHHRVPPHRDSSPTETTAATLCAGSRVTRRSPGRKPAAGPLLASPGPP